MSRAVWSGVLLCLLAGWARADEVILKNGRAISGEIVSEDDRSVVIKTAAGKVTLPRKQVKSVRRSEKRKGTNRDDSSTSPGRAELGYFPLVEGTEYLFERGKVLQLVKVDFGKAAGYYCFVRKGKHRDPKAKVDAFFPGNLGLLRWQNGTLYTVYATELGKLDLVDPSRKQVLLRRPLQLGDSYEIRSWDGKKHSPGLTLMVVELERRKLGFGSAECAVLTAGGSLGYLGRMKVMSDQEVLLAKGVGPAAYSSTTPLVKVVFPPSGTRKRVKASVVEQGKAARAAKEPAAASRTPALIALEKKLVGGVWKASFESMGEKATATQAYRADGTCTTTSVIKGRKTEMNVEWRIMKVGEGGAFEMRHASSRSVDDVSSSSTFTLTLKDGTLRGSMGTQELVYKRDRERRRRRR